MTVAKSFTAVGAGPEILVRHGASFTYDVSGTFAATLQVQQMRNGGWTVLASKTADAVGTLEVDAENKAAARVRIVCTAFASGTAVTRLTGTASDALGFVKAAEVTFTETLGAGVYTGSVTVPAGASILDILVNAMALWNPATSATLKVGDVATSDGFFTGVDLTATDLLAGESLSLGFAGGKEGAYIADSQVSPRYSATDRVISGVVTVVGGAGSTGRTRMTVVYHVPATGDVVAATKV